MGGRGAGQRTKLLNQAIVGVGYVLMAEILAAAKAADIDPHALPQCLEGSFADSEMLQRIYPQMAQSDYDEPRSRAGQVAKDLYSVLEFLDRHALDLPLVRDAAGRFGRFAADGNAGRDSAAFAEVHPARNGMGRTGTISQTGASVP